MSVGAVEAGPWDALLSLLTDRVDAALLAACPSLGIVANMAVGTDNVDVAAATRLGIAVANTPDVLTDATADLAFGLLLAAARRIVPGDRLVRAGEFSGWRPDLGMGHQVTGKRLLIVGPGRIGRAVAERAAGFRMHVEPWGRRATRPLHDALAEADFVSLHVPLDASTRHLIGEPQLRAMRPHAVLVNTSRGPVIDEATLVRALREGWIGAAGLDVFEREPALAPGLSDLPNVVLTPHIGSATYETRHRMATLAAENVTAWLRGEAPAHLVSP